MTHLKTISNDTLLSQTKAQAAREREATLDLLHYLREIARRLLFASLGYPTLFAYVTQELGYDSASAMRRIDAMALLRELPEVEQKIQDGLFSLSSAALAQGFFKKEQSFSKAAFPVDRKKQIIAALEGKSTREAEKTLLGFSQTPALHFRERVKPVSPTVSEVRFFADDALLSNLEKLKGLLGHSNPNMSTGELIAYLARLALAKLDPAAPRRGEKTAVSSDPGRKPASGSAQPKIETTVSGSAQNETARRYGRRPPQALIRAVWRRDGGRCVWREPKTGRVCGSQYRIQIDHRYPWALGGENSLENLQCLCAQHNQLEAAKWFGSERIRSAAIKL